MSKLDEQYVSSKEVSSSEYPGGLTKMGDSGIILDNEERFNLRKCLIKMRCYDDSANVDSRRGIYGDSRIEIFSHLRQMRDITLVLNTHF